MPENVTGELLVLVLFFAAMVVVGISLTVFFKNSTRLSIVSQSLQWMGLVIMSSIFGMILLAGDKENQSVVSALEAIATLSVGTMAGYAGAKIQQSIKDHKDESP